MRPGRGRVAVAIELEGSLTPRSRESGSAALFFRIGARSRRLRSLSVSAAERATVSRRVIAVGARQSLLRTLSAKARRPERLVTMRTQSISFTLAALAALLALAGCAEEDPTPDAPTSSEAAPAELSAAPLVASLETASGTKVEFYDFGDTSVVLERGVAYVNKPQLERTSTDSDQVARIWQQLAPSTPVPPELLALQERLDKLARERPASQVAPVIMEEVPVNDWIDDGASLGSGEKAACNNGCCNQDWMRRDFRACRGDLGVLFFHLSRPSSSVTIKKCLAFLSFACAARGTYHYTLTHNRTSLSMDIQEGHFVTFEKWGLAEHTLTNNLSGPSSGAVSHCVNAQRH